LIILITLQALQGVGAALMVPQSLAIINDCFTESERGKAIGLWAGISGGIAALGPLAGGWLIDTFSWNAVYFLVVPLCIGSVIITLLFVPAGVPEKGHKLDWIGAVLILIGLSGIVYSLMTAPASGWSSPDVLISIIVGSIALIVFILFELRQKQPLVYFNVFKNPLVTGSNIVTLLVYFGLNGVLFFTVLNLQQVQNYSPTIAGVALLPPIILITFLTWPTGALADRFGPRFQMISGPLIVSVGLGLLLTGGSDANYWVHFFPGLACFGIGMAVMIPPLTKSALSVESKYSGSASGINNGTARIAGLLAVAVLGAMIITSFRARLESGFTQSTLPVDAQQQILLQADKLGGITIPGTLSVVERNQALNLIHSAFISGYRLVITICSGLAFCGALVSAVLIHNETKKGGNT
jgi:MFS family permease